MYKVLITLQCVRKFCWRSLGSKLLSMSLQTNRLTIDMPIFVLHQTSDQLLSAKSVTAFILEVSIVRVVTR